MTNGNATEDCCRGAMGSETMAEGDGWTWKTDGRRDRWPNVTGDPEHDANVLCVTFGNEYALDSWPTRFWPRRRRPNPARSRIDRLS